MKLELKHLAPYLPYNLRRHCPSSNVLIHEFSSIDFTQSMIDFIQKAGWKPIFRPLSDLRNLMPNSDVCYISYMWYEIIGSDSESFDKDTFFEQCEIGNISFLPAMVIPKLLEWHFDVFGLIDTGLAIDINTLNNQVFNKLELTINNRYYEKKNLHR